MITLFRSLFTPPRHLILVLVAFWLGMALAEKRASRHGIAKDKLSNIAFFSMLGYVAGGRFLFTLSNWSAFRGNTYDIFSINLELFDPVGGLVTACIVGLIYAHRQNLPLRATLDALVPLFAALAIGLSLSHLAAGTAFGKPTNLPWAMELWNARRHPTQIYELVAYILIFTIVWLRTVNFPAGSDVLLFAALTAGARLLIEAFRGDSTLIFGGIRLAQLIAWFVLAVALFSSEAIDSETRAA